jgi:acetyltransferase-like isoleucine patch superfamily enzyme
MKRRFLWWYQRLRIAKYKLLSDCSRVQGKPDVQQPVQLAGRGEIRFNGHVRLGVYPSPFFLNGYTYIEARSPEAVVEFGDGVWMNNNCFFISDGPGIFIGKGTMFGTNCEVMDSDFHDTNPQRRLATAPKGRKVVIGDNVLIGSNAKILKGVRIGNNSVIANGAVVTKSVPENMLAFGNPLKVGALFSPQDWKQQGAESSATTGAGASH